MPDLATHVAAAWLLGRGTSLAAPVRASTVYLFSLGSALPDLLSRAPHLTFRSEALEYLTRPLHIPSALVLVSLSLSFLFAERERLRAFAALSLGALFHCLLDACQSIGPNSGYGWFFPFSERSPQLDLFSGDETVRFLPWVLAAALALEAGTFLRSRTVRKDGTSAGR